VCASEGAPLSPRNSISQSRPESERSYQNVRASSHVRTRAVTALRQGSHCGTLQLVCRHLPLVGSAASERLEAACTALGAAFPRGYHASRTGCCVTVQPALARVARTRCPARAAVLQHDIAKFILTFDTIPKDRWKKTKDDLNWSMARNTSRLGSKHVKTFWQICSSCVSAWRRTLRAFPDQTQSRLTTPSRTRCPHTCVP
jgi:hypothetical protein